MPASSHRPRRAFTLIELMIVIAVIIILVAITITVTVGILERSEARNTENTLRALDNIFSEFVLMRGRPISFGIENEPDDGNPATTYVYGIDQRRPAGFTWQNENQAVEDALIITDLIFAHIARIDELRSMIATLPPDAIREVNTEEDDGDFSHLVENGFDTTYRFLDAWDEPILAIHPGRTWQQGADEDYIRDNDGSIRTPYENRFGVAANRNLFFVSAGPSNHFGNLQLDEPRDAIDDDDEKRDLRRASDNIYSYDVLLDEARPEN